MPIFMFRTYEMIHEEREQGVSAETYEEALVKASQGNFEGNEGGTEYVYGRAPESPEWEEIPESNPKYYPFLVLWEEHQFMLKGPQDLDKFYTYACSKEKYSRSSYVAHLEKALLCKPSELTLVRNFNAPETVSVIQPEVCKSPTQLYYFDHEQSPKYDFTHTFTSYELALEHLYDYIVSCTGGTKTAVAQDPEHLLSMCNIYFNHNLKPSEKGFKFTKV